MITNDIKYSDECTQIVKLAMPMWKNKIAKEQMTIKVLFAVPIAIKYCSDSRKIKGSKASYLIKFFPLHCRVNQNAHNNK